MRAFCVCPLDSFLIQTMCLFKELFLSSNVLSVQKNSFLIPGLCLSIGLVLNSGVVSNQENSFLILALCLSRRTHIFNVKYIKINI